MLLVEEEDLILDTVTGKEDRIVSKTAVSALEEQLVTERGYT